MGIYRFWLAITVVMFHMGGISWLSGRIAVFSFYFISGYLIFRVLDKVYLQDWKHIGFFYANRLLRLLPLYTVIATLTYSFIWYRDGIGFIIDTADPPFNFVRSDAWFSEPSSLILIESIFGIEVSWMPFPHIIFTPVLIPQGWTIGIELCFYSLAPASVLLFRRHPGYLLLPAAISAAFFIFGVVNSPEASFMDKYIYKNFRLFPNCSGFGNL